jgi:hypothetical protein
MFATPQDFRDKYRQNEFNELFGNDDLCQESLNEAWGQMQIYLFNYVPFPPLGAALKPYELTLKGYQLIICRYLGSEGKAPREQVCEAYKLVIKQLEMIAKEVIQLPIYDPAVPEDRPTTATSKVVQRSLESSFSSFARCKW